ncbi:TRPL translocation defect protein 14, partial [Diplonema papillatum]
QQQELEQRRTAKKTSVRPLDRIDPRHRANGDAAPSSSPGCKPAPPPSTPMLSGRCNNVRAPRKVYRVVVTGGPCAGKSTGMAHIRHKLEKEGFNVFVVPEAATILIDGGAGAALQDFSHEERVFQFQLSLLKMQMQLEDNYCDIAKTLGCGPIQVWRVRAALMFVRDSRLRVFAYPHDDAFCRL